MWLPIRKAWQIACKRPWLTALAALLLVAAVSVIGVNSWAREHYLEAKKALQGEKHKDARAALEECLRVPWWRTADNYLLAARLERLQGNFSEARRLLKMSVDVRGQPTEASYIEELLLTADEGNPAPVEKQLQDLAAKKHADSPQILRSLAKVYILEGQYVMAMACLSAWLSNNPSSYEALRLRSQMWVKFHDVARAEEDIRRALTLAPDSSEARLELVELLMRTNGNLKEIEQHLDVLEQEHAKRPDYLLLVARCKISQGDFPAARKVLDQIFAMDNNSALAVFCRAELEVLDGKFADAEVWARKAAAKDPLNYQVYNILAESLKRQEDPSKKKEAEQHHNKYLGGKADADRLNHLLTGPYATDKDNPDILAEIGDILWRNGQKEAGMGFLKIALAKDPKHVPAHSSLAEYYTAAKQFKKAAEHQQLAKAPSPK